MFFGTLLIGIKAAGPVEQARRRQLEFTADASHELRTPLSVIEAEVSLALAGTQDRERLPGHPGAGQAREHCGSGTSSRTSSGFPASIRSPRRPATSRSMSPPSPGVRRPLLRRGPAPGHRPLGHAPRGRPAVDQRPARMDRPPHRRAGRQRLPLCRNDGVVRITVGADGQPGQSGRRGQRARHRPRRARPGSSTGSTGPPTTERSRPRPCHRRRRGASHRRRVAGRATRPRWSPHGGPLAPLSRRQRVRQRERTDAPRTLGRYPP